MFYTLLEKAPSEEVIKANWGKFNGIASEVFYVIIAIIFLMVGINALKTVKDGAKKITTAAFWFILAFIFAVGPHIPHIYSGIGVVLIAIITGINGVKQGEHRETPKTETRANANKLGYAVFLPALALALSAVVLAMVFEYIGGPVVLGISGIIGLIVALIVTKAPIGEAITEGNRLMDNVSTTGILPQLLTALGAIFTAAGVGEVISTGVSSIIPEGNRLVASIVYCVGMALFTIIMGNGFAAFSVITVGIGVPFLFAQGANPAIVGALGLTAGYCGTLCTPMAANFNIMPAALLETKNQYRIILSQVPYALVMLLIHIILLYTLAFNF